SSSIEKFHTFKPGAVFRQITVPPKRPQRREIDGWRESGECQHGFVFRRPYKRIAADRPIKMLEAITLGQQVHAARTRVIDHRRVHAVDLWKKGKIRVRTVQGRQHTSIIFTSGQIGRYKVAPIEELAVDPDMGPVGGIGLRRSLDNPGEPSSADDAVVN